MNGMTGNIEVHVLAAKRFKMDDFEGSQIYVIGGRVDEQDKCGTPPMKLSGSYAVLEKLRNHLPCKMSLTVEFRQGAKDKLEQYVLDATPVAGSGKESKPTQS